MRIGDHPKLLSSSLGWTSKIGVVGACLYIVGFVLPLKRDIPLIALVLCSTFAIVTSSKTRAPKWSPLTLAVMAFLLATALSTLVSEDISRSVRLSTPFLPAVLLFFVITEHFDDTKDVCLLYLTCSIAGIGLAFMVLWAAWKWHAWSMSGEMLRTVASDVGSPILVVANDVTFLAILSPFSFVLLLRKPLGVVGGLSVISLLLSGCAFVVLQSRTAILVMVVSLTGVISLIPSRHRLKISLLCGLAILLFMLLLDWILGFPLAGKFFRLGWDSDGRLPLWSVAWTLFLEAPVLGHGPHTYGLFRKTPWPHNLYLEVLAEQGILGLAALGFLFIYGLSTAWKLRRAVSGDAYIFGVGALAGLVGFCSAAVVELSFLRQWVVITLFILLGVIGRLSAAQSQQGRGGSWIVSLGI